MQRILQPAFVQVIGVIMTLEIIAWAPTSHARTFDDFAKLTKQVYEVLFAPNLDHGANACEAVSAATFDNLLHQLKAQAGARKDIGFGITYNFSHEQIETAAKIYVQKVDEQWTNYRF